MEDTEAGISTQARGVRTLSAAVSDVLTQPPRVADTAALFGGPLTGGRRNRFGAVSGSIADT